MRGTAEEIRVRPMNEGDLEHVAKIAKALPEAPQWAESVYRKAIEPDAGPPRMALVAEIESSQRVVGFAIAQLIPQEAELESIAVAMDAQGCGVGRRIFLELVQRLQQASVTELNLEVRASNVRAVAFYRGRGFRETGRRPRYYREPEEDAVLMSLSLADVGAEEAAEKG